MPNKLKQYLGNSVYADFNPQTQLITLTTENGLEPSNIIYLEPATISNFLNYLKWLENVTQYSKNSGGT